MDPRKCHTRVVIQPVSSRLPAAPARRLRVLLTGATGYIASQLLPVFRQRYDLLALDVRTTDAHGQVVAGVEVGDLLGEDWAGLRRQFTGADAVVHLGYFRPPGMSVTGAGKAYVDERPNVDMAEHVYRLALDEAVGRVVVASSNHAADWWEPLIHRHLVDVVTPADLPRSDNYYGWAKIAYEALGWTYACGAFGRALAMVQVRIGAPREIAFDGKPEQYKRDLGAYISPRDLQQLFVRAIETEHIEDEWGVPYQIVYGVSNNTRAFWSIANARRILGYAPEDDSEVRFAADIQRHLLSPGDRGRVATDPT
jgi:nucleoside-diphosphate-sugar epimerase